MNERTISLLGEKILKKIENCNVLLVGLGGVGGTAFEALVRTGFKNITIVDFDKFERSNLNRQILASEKEISEKKTEIALKRAKNINSNLNINVIDIYLNQENICILNKNYDYIIDACDTIDTKVLLVQFAIENNINIISCMGTAKRLDPSKVKITKINKTYNDPLAKIMRKKLKDKNINLNIPVVFSEELPKDTGKELGSYMLVPSTAGLFLVYYIISDLIEKE